MTTGRRDQGYSTIEAVVTLPAVILFTMLVVQYALLWHGRHIAEAAAQNGLRAARVYQATAGAGETAATTYLAKVAPNLITGTSVSATRSATVVTVRVSGQVLSVIPFGSFPVVETVSGPVERFVAVGSLATNSRGSGFPERILVTAGGDVA